MAYKEEVYKLNLGISQAQKKHLELIQDYHKTVSNDELSIAEVVRMCIESYYMKLVYSKSMDSKIEMLLKKIEELSLFQE